MKRALAVAAAVACVSCGASSLRTLPVGPGVLATDAADVVSQATASCRAVRTLTAEIAVSGSAGGRRIRGRLLAGVSAPAATRLEGLAPFGAPVFIMVADGDAATLLLPRDNRVLEHGRPRDVLEAISGVPLTTADLHATLTGCLPPASGAGPAGVRATQVGDWRIVGSAGAEGDDTESFLRRDATNAWRLLVTVHRAAEHPWRAEYGSFHDGLPQSVRIAAEDHAQFDVSLVLSQVEINIALGADAFRIPIPLSAEPITLADLRRSGPFAEPRAHGR